MRVLVIFLTLLFSKALFAAAFACPVINGTFTATLMGQNGNKIVKFVTTTKNGVTIYNDYVNDQNDWVANAIADNKKYPMDNDGTTQRTECIAGNQFIMHFESPKGGLDMTVRLNSDDTVDYFNGSGKEMDGQPMEHLTPAKSIAHMPVACPNLNGTYGCEGETFDTDLKTTQANGLTSYQLNGSEFIADGKHHVGGAGMDYVAHCDAHGVQVEVIVPDEPDKTCDTGFTRSRTIFSFTPTSATTLLSGQDNYSLCKGNMGTPVNKFVDKCTLKSR